MRKLSDQQSHELRKDVHEILGLIKRRPRFYLEAQSLEMLRTFLAGYEMGSRKPVLGSMREFSIWIAGELGYSGYSGGWCHMISKRAESAEKAFDMFFELYDKWRGERCAK